MRINWKIRIRNKTFWLSLTALLLVLANQISATLGVDVTIYNEQITNITESVLAILALLGVIVDPTTEGVNDSERAMRYGREK